MVKVRELKFSWKIAPWQLIAYASIFQNSQIPSRTRYCKNTLLTYSRKLFGDQNVINSGEQLNSWLTFCR